MNFKCLIILVMTTIMAVGFPRLSDADREIQTQLVAQINQNPTNPDLRFELAMEFASTGWIELGWEQLVLVPKLHDDYATVVFNTYSEIIKKNPSDWKAHFRLAFAYYFLDQKDNAIASFKRVLGSNPTHIWSMALIGLLYGEKKQYDECILWAKKGLKINNDATAIHFLLGKAYYETGNYLGVMRAAVSVGRLKSIEAKYRPEPPVGIEE
jgi:tetratricopeptide (TPR) repeat protein